MLHCFKGRFRSFADTTVTTSTDVESKQIVSSAYLHLFNRCKSTVTRINKHGTEILFLFYAQ